MKETSNGLREKFTLIFGLGYFEIELVRFLRERKKLKVVDIRREYQESLKDALSGVELINGDASSIVTWKKISVNEVMNIIITIKDPDVVSECCRIAREVYKLDVQIIVLSYGNYSDSILDKYNVNIVHPLNVGIEIIASMIEKNVAWPVNIGKGAGEIVEVQVLRYSHLVGVRLKHLRPTNWSVALIYSGGKILLPNKESRINIGDRLIIVGDPQVVKSIVDTLSKGVPNFPLRFGQTLSVYISANYPDIVQEAVLIHSNTLSKKLTLIPHLGKGIKGLADEIKNRRIEFETGDSIASLKDLRSYDKGVLVVPKRRVFCCDLYYKGFFREASSPVLFAKGSRDYDRVLISLNSETPSFALETGIELAGLLKKPYEIIYVCAPEALRGQKETEYLSFRKNIVADYEISEGVKLDFTIKEGNPVFETLGRIKEFGGGNTLLVLTFDPKEKIGIFAVNVPYLLTRSADCSVLAVPVGEKNA
ncbi:MAG: NAD-binding protein [Deferribacterales bacterium]